jgi:hypothetical protein
MTRTTLALPIDVARLFDSTVSTAQISADTFQNTGDDTDLLESMIEDAEDEFHRATDNRMKIGTVGLPGTRETYEQQAYDISGHNAYKRNFSAVFSDYDRDQKTLELDRERILPFDPAAGDEVYIYRGLDEFGESWEDITAEQGESWDILNHRQGVFVFGTELYYESIVGDRGGLSRFSDDELSEVRFAITYRYGGLGGSRSTTAEATLDTSITDTETGSVAITDAAGVPSTSEVVVKIDREYLSVAFAPDAGTVDILKRGVRGTQAASHDADATIVYTPPAVRKAVSARAAEQLVVSGRYQDWLPDTEDDIDKDGMLEEFSGYWESTVGALSG